VAMKDSRLRIPPQAYIANPNPLDITGDLAG
jgi:hypothetical protein